MICWWLFSFFLFFFFFFFFAFFPRSTLCLQVGNRSGFWVWFQLSFFFIWCQLFACLIRAVTDFSFATSICGLVFPCYRHLCTVSFFHGLFCRRPSCQTFCICLVSACFRVYVYLSVSRIMLCACCSSAGLGDSNWNFFQVGYPVDTPGIP